MCEHTSSSASYGCKSREPRASKEKERKKPNFAWPFPAFFCLLAKACVCVRWWWCWLGTAGRQHINKQTGRQTQGRDEGGLLPALSACPLSIHPLTDITRPPHPQPGSQQPATAPFLPKARRQWRQQRRGRRRQGPIGMRTAGSLVVRASLSLSLSCLPPLCLSVCVCECFRSVPSRVLRVCVCVCGVYTHNNTTPCHRATHSIDRLPSHTNNNTPVPFSPLTHVHDQPPPSQHTHHPTPTTHHQHTHTRV